jgi:uncharacterized protein (UPF0332 family)
MDEEQEELIEAAWKKLDVAKKLREEGDLADSVSRAYYGMFHAARAMLLEEGSKPKTHQGVISELGKLFRESLDPELISEMSQIQSLREDADYEPYFKIEKQRAEEVLQTAEKLIDQIEDKLQ